MPSSQSTPCWVIHDGAAGNRQQAVALAHALQLEFTEWSLSAKPMARWLAPREFPGAQHAFGRSFAECLQQAPPALAIGCGRLAALATRLARGHGARAVQILDPRLSTRHWDWVVAPEHDALQGGNVLTLCGSLGPVDDAWLRDGRERFAQGADLLMPRTAVLVGGPTRATPLHDGDLQWMCALLEQWLARDGGCLMLCGSRRTPPGWKQLLRARFGHAPNLLWLDDSDGVNAYPQALAWADRIVVTPDSVNMLSEACATTAPVYVAEPARASGRIARFIGALIARGRLRVFTPGAESFSAAPLRETARVARLLRERLGLD